MVNNFLGVSLSKPYNNLNSHVIPPSLQRQALKVWYR